MDSKYTAGVCKIVSASDVEKYTSEGWRLIDIVQTTENVGFRTDIVVAPDYSGGPMGKQSVLNPIVGIVSQYVLMKDPESALAALNGELAATNQRLSEAETAVRASEASDTKLRAELEAKTRAVGVFRESLDDHVIQLRNAQSTIRRMEVDLGKVRTEIGEAEMRRILGTG